MLIFRHMRIRLLTLFFAMIYCWLLLHRHCAQQLQAQAELSKNYERGIISIRLNRIIASNNIKIEI